MFLVSRCASVTNYHTLVTMLVIFVVCAIALVIEGLAYFLLEILCPLPLHFLSSAPHRFKSSGFGAGSLYGERLKI